MDKINEIKDWLKKDEIESNVPGKLYKSAKSALIASRMPFGLLASYQLDNGSLMVCINGKPSILFE